MEKATLAVYEFGPYRLETAQRLLLYEGKGLTLAPKTFDLLQILVQSRGRVLTKKELMSALWPDSFVEESNLAFQISALRKVLGTKGGEWIETLPKYGYRFSGPVSQIAVEPSDSPTITELPENGRAEPARGNREPALGALRRGATLRKPINKFVWALIALLVIVTALYGLLAIRKTKPQQNVVRFLISPPPKVTIQDLDSLALAPDGSRLAFIGESSDGQKQLWLRPLDSVDAEPLAGTELVTSAFWSPDSASLAFFAGGKLKRIDLRGGAPQTICNAPLGRGTWSKDGVILIDSLGAEIYKVPAAGGEPEPATGLDRNAQETVHAAPQFLPDGRHFIYFVRSSRPENTGIYIGSLDAKGRKRVVNSNTNAAYASVPYALDGNSGYLLYTAGTDLVRQPFDLKKQALVGDPAVLAHRVLMQMTRGIARATFSVSQNGVLAYRTRAESGNTELVWLDRQGRRLSRVGEPGDYSNPALSPDESKLVVSRTEVPTGGRDLWLLDLSSGAKSRFTFDPGDTTNAVWSADSRAVAFNAVHDGAVDIYLKPVTGTTKAKELLASRENKQVECWSPDGRYILYRIDNKTWILPVDGGKVTGPYPMEYPAISPDSRWVAYTSNESGRMEVYVQTFPPTEGRWQISTTGGTEPLWRSDGKELYYLSGDKLMAVDVKTNSGALEPGVARVLFEARLESTRRRSRYQVADNGRRFLVNLPIESSSPVTVTINWAASTKP